MAMTWAQLKYSVRATVDELSSRGTILPATKVADLEKKLKYFINPLLYELASTTGKLAATKNILLNPVDNTLSYDTSSIKAFAGTDFSIELTGAKAYFFESCGPATVKIEEYKNGVWVELKSITIPSTVTDLTEYKGLITPSSTSNRVRLRFTGSSPYSFRNYKLYTYTWATDADVQQHRPFFKFEMPVDFLRLNKIYIRKDTRQFVPLIADYVWEEPNILWINRYLAPAELQVKYWRKPAELTWIEPDDISDLATIDATDDAVKILPLGLAARAMIAEKDETSGMILQNLWEAAKSQLVVGNMGGYSGELINVTGW